MNIERNSIIRRTAHQLWTARLVAALLTAMWCGAVQAAGDAARGATLYQGCEDCHSIAKNDVGPLHKGVVGRKAGSVPDYAYSAALKNSNIVWTEENLDKWLTNPQALVPGTKMFFQVNSAKDRGDLIAFLKERAK